MLNKIIVVLYDFHSCCYLVFQLISKQSNRFKAAKEPVVFFAIFCIHLKSTFLLRNERRKEKFLVPSNLWLIGCEIKAHCLHERPGLNTEVPTVGGLSKGSYPVFTPVSEKTTENSERLNQQA